MADYPCCFALYQTMGLEFILWSGAMAAVAIAQPGRRNNRLLCVAALIVALAVVFVIANQAHANAKHKEAEWVRTTYRNKACTSSEMWFSPVIGTVMILCKMDNTTDLWGGMSIRFVENYSALTNGIGEVRWLSENNKAYEATCMARPWRYWEGVKKRDGYVSLFDFVDVQTRFFEWFARNF